METTCCRNKTSYETVWICVAIGITPLKHSGELQSTCWEPLI